jgi:hypothetical protein
LENIFIGLSRSLNLFLICRSTLVDASFSWMFISLGC